MKRITGLTITILALAFLSSQSAYATARTWNNLGTDWNTTANWNGGTPNASGAVGSFTDAETVQPNLSASVSIAGIYFQGTASSGYDITSSAGQSFTLLGTGATGNNGTANGSAAAIRSEITLGTNTVDAPIILGAAAATTQVLYQAAGGTLIVNGGISNTNAITTLSFKGTGLIELNGSNTFTNPSDINDSGTTLQIGNDSALGSGTFSFNSSGTLQAGNGARTIANNVVLASGTDTIGGSNALTVNGNVSTAGANSRTLTVTNTALTTFNGVTINGNTAAGTLIVNGTGNATIGGVIGDGNFAGSILSHGGTGTLTLNNANTYTGGTLISGALTIANHDGAFSSGNVSLTASNVTLTLQNGTLNTYIANSAAFSLFDGTDTVNLNYTGTDTVNTLTVALASEAPGVYGSATSGAPNVLPEFTGTGTITVLTSAVPEPSTLAMIAVGAASLIGAQLRRKRS